MDIASSSSTASSYLSKTGNWLKSLNPVSNTDAAATARRERNLNHNAQLDAFTDGLRKHSTNSASSADDGFSSDEDFGHLGTMSLVE